MYLSECLQFTECLRISRICIFGSVARGEQTEDSDVDICVDLVNFREIDSYQYYW